MKNTNEKDALYQQLAANPTPAVRKEVARKLRDLGETYMAFVARAGSLGT